MQDDKEIELKAIGQEVLKEMTKKWKTYIQKTESKYKSHIWGSRYWSNINKAILTTMALLGAAATLLALLQTLSIFIIAGLTGLFTLILCLYVAIQPAEMKHKHLRSSKEFQNLMMRMVRCRSGIEFEELWHDLNRTVFEEPHLKKRHIYPISKDSNSVQWTMSGELSRFIETKKQEAKRLVKQYSNRGVGTTSDVVGVEPWPQPHSTNTYYPSYNTYPASTVAANYTNNNGNYSARYQNGFNHNQKAILTTGGDAIGGQVGYGEDAFEVLIAQRSHAEVWEDGKRKKRQVFEQFRRSQSTKP